MVVFDATILLPFLSPTVPAPLDSQTGQPVTNFRDRIDHLVKTLEKGRTKIIVPTPVLSEILVRSGEAGPDYLSQINAAVAFRIAPFDERAAVEVAAMTREAIATGNKRVDLEGTWAKIKYDRQIVAIAKVEGASVIYSDDGNIAKIAESVGITTIRIEQLPLPPVLPQLELDFEAQTKAQQENSSEC